MSEQEYFDSPEEAAGYRATQRATTTSEDDYLASLQEEMSPETKNRLMRMGQAGLVNTNDRLLESKERGMARRGSMMAQSEAMQGRSAPTMQTGDYNAATFRAMDLRRRQVGLGGEYSDAVAGNGPSAAAVQQQYGVGKGVAAQFAAGGQGLGQVNAARAGGAALGGVVNEASTARSAEQNRAQTEYADMLAKQRGQDLTTASTGMSMMEAQINNENKQRAMNDAMTKAYQAGDYAYAEQLYQNNLKSQQAWQAYQQHLAENQPQEVSPWEYATGFGEVGVGIALAPFTGGATVPVAVKGAADLADTAHRDPNV